MSTCHCGTNMTEVAQVAAVVAHDMDNVTNENEHSTSDAENKDDNVTQEEDDVAVNEDDDAEETSEKSPQKEDEEPCHTNDDESNETDKPRVNGVEHEENEKKVVAQDGEKKDDAQPDTNEEQNVTDVILKKEVREKSEMRNIFLY